MRVRLVTDHHEITDPSELPDKATDLHSVNIIERRAASNSKYTTPHKNKPTNETNQYNRLICCYNCNREDHMGRDCRTSNPNDNNNNQYKLKLAKKTQIQSTYNDVE